MSEDKKASKDSQKAADSPSNDSPPDRLSIDPGSRYYSEETLDRGIGIRFKGKERTNVQEYSISEGWVKMVVGKTVDRYGQPLTVKMKGEVEAWYKEEADDDSAVAESTEDATSEKDKPAAKSKTKSKAKSKTAAKGKSATKSKAKTTSKTKTRSKANTKANAAPKSQSMPRTQGKSGK